ncbi:GAF domain-containing protein [Thiohalorhabdus sp.]|uniref:GAF domain-containing protein n=1 Tax=Thiohalorhabdus sp. TaxID=3094134 RepID=UPI002FC34696
MAAWPGLAWVAIPDGQGWVHPVAASGDASAYLAHLAIATDPRQPESRGPTGIAMYEDRQLVEPDSITDPAMCPLHAAAEAAGLRSLAAFRFHRGGKVEASLNVYADESHFVSVDLIHLLDEMVLDISLALDHHDRMAEHRRLIEIVEATPEVVGMADSAGNLLYPNPAAMVPLSLRRTEGNIAKSHPPNHGIFSGKRPSRWPWNTGCGAARPSS